MPTDSALGDDGRISPFRTRCSSDLAVQKKQADQLVLRFTELWRNKSPVITSRNVIRRNDLAETCVMAEADDSQAIPNMALLDPSIIHTPPVSLVITPPEPVSNETSATRLTRSRAAKVSSAMTCKSIAEPTAAEPLLTQHIGLLRARGDKRKASRRRGIPVGLEEVAAVSEEKPELPSFVADIQSLAPENVDNNRSQPPTAQIADVPSTETTLVLGAEAQPRRRGRPKKVVIPDEHIEVKTEMPAEDEQAEISSIGRRRRKKTEEIDADAGSVVFDTFERRRSTRLKNPPTSVAVLTAKEFSAEPVPPDSSLGPNGVHVEDNINIDEITHVTDQTNADADEPPRKRGRKKGEPIRAANPAAKKRAKLIAKRLRETAANVTTIVADEPSEADAEGNNLVVDKICPNCPDVLCTRQHLLAVHNNIHPDEYSVLRTQRQARKKRWIASVAAGYKLRCQNAGCDKEYTTPEGLQYHLTDEGLCLAPAHLRPLRTDPEPIQPTIDEKPQTVEFDPVSGRARRSAAVKAAQSMKQVLVDERRSDRAVESAATHAGDDDADESDPWKRLKKRRRNDSLGSEFSFSSRSDDGSYAEGASNSSLSSSESDTNDNLDEENDSMQHVDDDDADEADPLALKKIRRDKKMSRLLLNHQNCQTSTRNVPSKTRHRVDAHLMPRIYEAVCRALWQTHSNTTLRRPTDKLLRCWTQAVQLTGVCVCRMCSHESQSAEDAVTHFISCEKANELQQAESADAEPKSIMEAFYLPDEYEVRTVENLLRCRLCSFTQEGCASENLAAMAKHCARHGGAHSQLLNHVKFQSLIRDLLTSCRQQMDGCRTRELMESITKAALPFLCVPEQREQMLNSAEFGRDRLKEKVAAYKANIALLQRARQQVLMIQSTSKPRPTLTATAAENTEKYSVDDSMVISDEVNDAQLAGWLQLHAPTWLSQLYSQFPDLPGWKIPENSSSQRSSDSTNARPLVDDIFSPAFCVTNAEAIPVDGAATAEPLVWKKQTSRLFDVCRISITAGSSSSLDSNNGVQLSFIGGNVTAVCWLPQTVVDAEDASVVFQILAVTVERQKPQSDFAKNTTWSSATGMSSSSSSEIDRCIQFWRVRRSRTDSPEPYTNGKLEFAGTLASDHGTVRALSFLPLAPSAALPKLNDFTVLAAATESGVCALYLIYLSMFTRAESSPGQPVLLSPLMLLCLPRRIFDANALLPITSATAGKGAETVLQCEPIKFCSIAWLPVAQRNEILVGGDDGLIAVFRLDVTGTGNSNILCRKIRLDGSRHELQATCAVQLFPIATVTFGRGLISHLNYCFLNKPAEFESSDASAAENVHVFIVSRESKLAFYMSHRGLLQHAAYAAAHGGGDSALLASTCPRQAAPVYWRVGGDHSHLVSCLTNTSPQTMLDNVMGGVFAAYGDAQTTMLTRAHYFSPPAIVRKQVERLLNSAIQSSGSGAEAAAISDEKSMAGGSRNSSLADRFSAAVLRMRRNMLMVNAAAHQQSFTALAVTGNAADESAASAYPCLASADQTGNVFLNDMLLAAWPAVRFARREAEKHSSKIDDGSRIANRSNDAEDNFEQFAVHESKRRNAWRSQCDQYKPLANNNWLRRALLTTALIHDDSTHGEMHTSSAKIINFRFFPAWNVEAMAEAETLDRGKKDLEDRVELMLGREDELAVRSVSMLSWCPPTQLDTAEQCSIARSSNVTAAVGGSEEAVTPPQLLVFNEAGFMMLFDGNLL